MKKRKNCCKNRTRRIKRKKEEEQKKAAEQKAKDEEARKKQREEEERKAKEKPKWIVDLEKVFCSTTYETEKVPDELMLCIFSYLDSYSRRAVSLTCKRWNTLMKDPGLFRLLREMNLMNCKMFVLNAFSRFEKARGMIKWLNDTSNQTTEFWDIFFKSIPADQNVDLSVSTSVDMHQLTWRAEGSPNVFIQNMVDFFWNVGAPELEIDRLNNIGALINPPKIGVWIDVSDKGGLDGGWFFPVKKIPLAKAFDKSAADLGNCIEKFKSWISKYFPPSAECQYVGRDMGAEPPRQVEYRIELPATLTLEDQINAALDAHSMFNFPHPPKEALEILRKCKTNALMLSVNISSNDEFVRIGLLQPKPDSRQLVDICKVQNIHLEKFDKLMELEKVLGGELNFIEYQYLKEGYGYRVYAEGFKVVLHYGVIGKEVSRT